MSILSFIMKLSFQPIGFNVTAVVWHWFDSELPGSPGEKEDVMNNSIY